LFSSPTTASPTAEPGTATCGASREEVVAAARTLLIGLGHLNPSDPDSSGAALSSAVRLFQREVFLEPTGSVDGALLVRIAEEAARRARA